MSEMNIPQQVELSKYIAGSAMSPHKREQDVLFALMVGTAIGLPPAVAVLNIVNINGRPCISADIKMALVRQHPQYAGCKITSTADACTVEMKRKREDGGFDEITATFGKEDAERAGLLKKDNYRYYPARMYKARAISYACNDLFPDAVWGVISAEESADIPSVDINDLYAEAIEMISLKITDPMDAEHWQSLAESAKITEDLPEMQNILKKLRAKKATPKPIKTAVELVEIETPAIDSLANSKITLQKLVEFNEHPDKEALIAKIWAAKSESDLAALSPLAGEQ